MRRHRCIIDANRLRIRVRVRLRAPEQRRRYPPPHAPERLEPAANRAPTSARARSETAASEIPSFANERDDWLVRSDHTETTNAPSVASAQTATIASERAFQWCAHWIAAASITADSSPRPPPTLPRTPKKTGMAAASIIYSARCRARNASDGGSWARKNGPVWQPFENSMIAPGGKTFASAST